MNASTPRSKRATAAVTSAFALVCATASLPAQAASGSDNTLVGLGSLTKTTQTVTVKSVDPATRHLVVTDGAGQNFSLKAPNQMHNFAQLKPGDKISATYAVETVFALSPPNSKLPPDTETVIAGRAAKGELPAAVVANHVVVTGAIIGIDRANHTLKIVSPQGGEVHTMSVKTPAGRAELAKLKNGDYVTAYITEALLLTTKPA